MAKILVVDDDPEIRWVLSKILTKDGFEVVLAEDGEAAVYRLRADAPSAVLLDLRMPVLGGMEALEKIRQLSPQVPVIMLTAYGDIPTVVEAMRRGADDFLTKPFDVESLLLAVRHALGHRAGDRRGDQAAQAVEEPQGAGALSDLMGMGLHIQTLWQQAEKVARCNFTVVLQGETGTGKEIVARAIHLWSYRAGKPFIALDCGAIPETLIESELFGHEKGAFTGAHGRREGHFQLADGGTLFLDEITNLPHVTQAKLLRTLQERCIQPLGGKHPVKVDVRIIAASNVSLEGEMLAGRFRKDLYYRLNEYTITLPPLRDRPEDIPFLARRFLVEACQELDRAEQGFSPDALDLLREYPWPGNARELRNAVRQAVLMGTDEIAVEQLLASVRPGGARGPLPQELDARALDRPLRELKSSAADRAERAAIEEALRLAGGNKAKAARLLQINYKTLYTKLKHYGIRYRQPVP
ncbi:MAG: sigma-54-dependent Fis family transcriptional regulator [Gemmatimonadetes bacterium]|nr:sigma-54-dependent Fis family transcriptional regulator [Gemmatimonadota bacterium]